MKLYYTMCAGGFVTVSDILSTRQGSKYTEEDVKRVVTNCPKSRFTLKEDTQSGLLIRANQGHTIQVHHNNMYTLATYSCIWSDLCSLLYVLPVHVHVCAAIHIIRYTKFSSGFCKHILHSGMILKILSLFFEP